jgi:hypothetical protein
MNDRTVNSLVTVLDVAMSAAFLWLIWGWWSFSGLYRLLAHLELQVFGSFGAISTFVLGVVLIGGLAGVAHKPLLRVRQRAGLIQRRSPADAKAMTKRAMAKLALGGGALALVVTLAAAGLLYRDSQRSAVTAELNLSSPAPLPAGVGRVRLIGFTEQNLLVVVENKQTPGVTVDSTAYMAVVGPDWRPGTPVPVVVQGSPGLGVPSNILSAAAPDQKVPFDLSSGVVQSITSGFAADLLAERGAIVDSHTVFLDTRPDAERDALLPVVILGGLFAVMGVAGGLMTRRSIA